MNDQLSSIAPDSVRVETRFPGGDRTHCFVPLQDSSVTVAQLIRSKIASEWASTGGASIESADPGSVVSPWVSQAEAVRHALDAYRAGWYIVIVDGTQPSGLDSAIELCAESRVVFARLHPVREGLL